MMRTAFVPPFLNHRQEPTEQLTLLVLSPRLR